MLILAKIGTIIYFDHRCGQMMYVIKNLFCTCIKKAFWEDDTDIISFVQEMYSTFKRNDLLIRVIDLFLLLEDQITEKTYS